jgi:DNA integrity scanning protein DisA with diadenylate cyclase activity
MHLGVSPDDAIIGLMSQDGATIISADGAIVQGMTFLRPPVGTAAQEEVGRGSKHSTAAKISSATAALSVAVSVDGRVTLYSGGEVKLKVMG